MDVQVLKDFLVNCSYSDLVGKRLGIKDTKTGDVISVVLGEKQFVFLHVPKTGGTYVARNKFVIEPIIDLNHAALVEMPYVGSSEYPPDPGYRFTMREDVDLVKNLHTICFATVRNPFDWFVSYWYHVCSDLNIEPHYDYEIANKGFEYFLKSISEREDGWPSQKLLYFAFFEYNQNFIVDRLIHQENLDLELEEFANDFDNLQYRKSDKRARESVGREKDYRKYYDWKLVDLVKGVWGRDLFLFGYDFHGKVSGFFEKNISDQLKKEFSICGKKIN